jgi:hypothetical protein
MPRTKTAEAATVGTNYKDHYQIGEACALYHNGERYTGIVQSSCDGVVEIKVAELNYRIRKQWFLLQPVEAEEARKTILEVAIKRGSTTIAQDINLVIAGLTHEMKLEIAKAILQKL